MPSILQDQTAALRLAFASCSDIRFQPFKIDGNTECLLVYVEGLVDSSRLDLVILGPLSSSSLQELPSILSHFQQQVEVNAVIQSVLIGKTAIIIEGLHSVYIADLVNFKQRAILEPGMETSIRGPKEGFTESLATNTSLLRRKIVHPGLKIENYEMGSITNTRMVLCYMEGLVNESILLEARQRINKAKDHTRFILDSSYLEEMIEGNSYSLFPQIMNTERPDSVAACLLEGKVAVIVDGSPNALVLPMTFWSGFQAAEDHYERFIYVTAVRGIRMLLVLLSLMLPSLYVALTTFHPQMIPLYLMMSIAAAREGIPFPTVVETLLMEIMFEGLREAGLRLPKAIGSTISIVGALVIGEAAVQAGFISAPIVMIVAGTGIASFSFPRYSLGLPFRLLRFPFLFLAGLLGLFGVAICTIFILIHMLMLSSFGVPYLSPVAPFESRVLKDTLLRLPRNNFMAKLIKKKKWSGEGRR